MRLLRATDNKSNKYEEDNKIMATNAAHVLKITLVFELKEKHHAFRTNLVCLSEPLFHLFHKLYLF